MFRSNVLRTASFALAFAAFGSGVASAQTAAVDLAMVVSPSPSSKHLMRAVPSTAPRVVKRLTLDAGTYEFDITNVSIDDELGFVLQRVNASDAEMRTTDVPNGATRTLIARGETARTGEVYLKRGRYVVSRSMESTPYYVINVR